MDIDIAAITRRASAVRPPIDSDSRPWADGMAWADRADLLAERAELIEALERLASMEAFDVARVIKAPQDDELIARVDYARRILALVLADPPDEAMVNYVAEAIYNETKRPNWQPWGSGRQVWHDKRRLRVRAVLTAARKWLMEE